MSSESGEGQHIKKMADLLCQGSALTELACPACASPLLRLKTGGLWCARCEKKVIVAKEGEDAGDIIGSTALDTLEQTLLVKIQEIQIKMQLEEDSGELQKLDAVLSGLLQNLERTRKVKKT